MYHLGIIFISIFTVVLIILQILLYMNYPKSFDKKRKRDLWNLYGAEHLITKPLAIYINSKEENELNEFGKFNSLVLYFWLNFILLLIGVVLINIS